MRDLLRLLKYLKPFRLTFFLATLAMLAVGLLESATLALIVPIFDNLRAGGTGGAGEQSATLFNLQKIIPDTGVAAWRTIALLLVVFTVGKGVAEYFSTYLMAYIGQSSVRQLRHDLYAHILRQSAGFFERHRTNFLVSRLVSSSAAIETAVTSTLRDMLRESFALVAFLAASFYYNWRLTLGTLMVAPIVAVMTAKFGKALRIFAHESFEGSKLLTDTAQETMAHQTIVKAYRAEPREMTRFGVVTELIARANLRTARIAGIAPPTIEMVGVLAVVVLLFFAQREILAGRMNVQQFLTFLVFIFRSYDPMRKLSRLQNNLEQALAAARHVWEVMDEHDEIHERADAVELSAPQTAIELHDVAFRYPNETRDVLRDINLRVPVGGMVALVGESGGGKSTLTKLLPRFHDPTEGAVLWDGIDLRAATLDSLRRHISLVTQETTLFNDTVRHNIAYGRPEATDAEIEAAARIAFARDFIIALPKGYDTPVGERGAMLSGGQRQRLAIARAVLTDAPVLILDEATSALDAESERAVQDALDNLIKNRTTLVIAHRLSTVRRADLIVVLEKGRIVETGTHRELLARGGVYRKLYELQFAAEEDAELVEV